MKKKIARFLSIALSIIIVTPLIILVFSIFKIGLSLYFGSNTILLSKTVTVINYSDQPVYFQFSCEDSLVFNKPLELFSILKEGDNFKQFAPRYRIPSFTSIEIGSQWEHLTEPLEFGSGRCQTDTRNSNWDSLINTCYDKTVKFYFIKEKTMRSRTWKEIYLNQLYEQKIDLSIDTLNKPRSIIKYSMSESEIKMLKNLIIPMILASR